MPIPIPRHVRSLSDLVLWLAETHHGGAVFRLAERTKLSPAILSLWSHNIVQMPKTRSLMQLADAYDLNSHEVLALVIRTREKELVRQQRLLQAELRRLRQRPRRPIAGGSAQGAALPLPSTEDKSPLSEVRRRVAWLLRRAREAAAAWAVPDFAPACA